MRTPQDYFEWITGHTVDIISEPEAVSLPHDSPKGHFRWLVKVWKDSKLPHHFYAHSLDFAISQAMDRFP
jgi:hypothetical protein